MLVFNKLLSKHATSFTGCKDRIFFTNGKRKKEKVFNKKWL